MGPDEQWIDVLISNLRYCRASRQRAVVRVLNADTSYFLVFLLLNNESHILLEHVASCFGVLEASLQHFDRELGRQAL